MTDELLEAIEDALEFISQYEDVMDGSHGEQRPNRAMQIATRLRAAVPSSTANGNLVMPLFLRATEPSGGQAPQIESKPDEHNAVAVRDALAELVRIIDSAGLLNLSNGVQLGPTSWYVKASDSMEAARKALADGLQEQGEPHRVKEPLAPLREYLAICHDSELMPGDRLQRISVRIQAELRGKPYPSVVREAICLLNSMLACGEDHSDRSREVVRRALLALGADRESSEITPTPQQGKP